jgi:hypothetical protein
MIFSINSESASKLTVADNFALRHAKPETLLAAQALETYHNRRIARIDASGDKTWVSTYFVNV